MADQPYYYSAPDLGKIIAKTNDAISEMNQLNNMVMSNKDALGDANRSDSGKILTEHLATWNADFNTCVANLHDLNEKAVNLLKVNIATDLDATGNAK